MSNNTSSGWMQHLIDKVDEQDQRTDSAKILVVGEFGSGKTYFANTWPDTFWIDTDHGMATTRTSATDKGNRRGLRFYPGDAVYEPIMSFCAAAEKKPKELEGIKTVVLDGWSSLSKALLYEIVGGSPDSLKGRKPEFDHYGSLRTRMNDIQNALLRLPYHVIATCLGELDKDEATGSYIGKLVIIGGFRDDIGSRYDEVYYVDKRRSRSNEPGDVVYEMYTEFHPKFKVKSRLKQAAAIPSKMVNATYDNTFKGIFG